MSEATFTAVGTVVGMTCQHCVASVVEGVRSLSDVRQVSIDLPSGQLSLTTEQPIDRAALCRAVADVGYELVLSGTA
ncbi:heavy-metal-associated domain-containing protein [Pseudonocardia spinosispora]|uniref:heavy-metal-associated domain-containing protein n=1 Tax=Pseudonocardia spinosispora TaxID=103441 RepID=UPI0004087D82|nr:heavy metal-associated domain-containing protein [Pseudonocardia spinosispora]